MFRLCTLAQACSPEGVGANLLWFRPKYHRLDNLHGSHGSFNSRPNLSGSRNLEDQGIPQLVLLVFSWAFSWFVDVFFPLPSYSLQGHLSEWICVLTSFHKSIHLNISGHIPRLRGLIGISIEAMSPSSATLRILELEFWDIYLGDIVEPLALVNRTQNT